METNKEEYHVPVMLQECLDGLDIQPDGVYVDVTFGGGGHSRAIFEKLGPNGKLISFDQDQDAKANTWNAPNFHFVQSNFTFMKNHLKMLGITKVDGILADLGVSSHQFNAGERGFSIRSNDRLDMRMNQSAKVSAETILNTYESEALALVFYKYSDLKKVRFIVQNILQAREAKALQTTGDLIAAIAPLAPKFKENKFYAQVFQAVRIEVNQEMEALESFLLQTNEVLKEKGRLVVMSYHSLEDRLVKNYVKRGSFKGEIEKDFFGNILKPYTEITRHPISPNEEELERNPRSRSAKLRIAQNNG
jgi:16S rRNA (cytosine1402-N4)-methyltransferase